MNRQSILRLSTNTLSELKTKASGWKLLNPAIEQILIYDTLIDVGPDPDPYPYLIIAVGDDIGEFNNDLPGTDLYGKTLFLVADTAEMADRLALSHMRDYFDNRYDSDEERYDPDEKLRDLPETNIDCLLCEVLVGGNLQTKKPAEVEAKPSENYFYRKGDVWHVGFGGKEAHIKHVDGLIYIGYLLKRPGTSVSCSELYQAVSGKATENTLSANTAIDESLNINTSKHFISDSKAKQAYWAKWQQLRGEYDNTEDSPEGELIKQQIQKEIDEIEPFLKERAFTDPNKRKAQINVGKRLDTAYQRIRKAGMKNLEKHLQNHIKPDDAYGLFYSGNHNWEIIT